MLTLTSYFYLLHIQYNKVTLNDSSEISYYRESSETPKIEVSRDVMWKTY